MCYRFDLVSNTKKICIESMRMADTADWSHVIEDYFCKYLKLLCNLIKCKIGRSYETFLCFFR